MLVGGNGEEFTQCWRVGPLGKRTTPLMSGLPMRGMGYLGSEPVACGRLKGWVSVGQCWEYPRSEADHTANDPFPRARGLGHRVRVRTPVCRGKDEHEVSSGLYPAWVR